MADYRVEWLRGDLIAGVTLAAYVVPQSMAYASLAGLPPVTGLYCYMLAGAAYLFFGSSRRLSVGTTSAIALLVGTTLAALADGDAARQASLAMLAALLVALLGVVAWALRLGQIVYFISEPILLGFKAGAAFVIASTQLPKLFGIAAGGDHFFERIRHVVAHLGETNGASLAVGLAAIALLLGGERVSRRLPIPLVVVALSILATDWFELAARGVAVVGEIPGGLPGLALPSIQAGDLVLVTPLALACFLLAYVEGVSTARALATGRGERIDPDQELLAVGATNLLVGIGHGFPVSGGMSQSAVNDQAGARTPLSLGFASAVLALVLLFLTGLFRNLPQPTLAALVLAAVVGLVNVPELRRLRSLSRTEFRVAMVGFAGVLLLGILQGVLLAAIFSLLVLIRRVATPRIAVLGRVRETDQFADTESGAENTPVPGVLVLRPGSGLLYFNVESVRESLRARAAEARDGVRLVVMDLSSANQIDLSGVALLAELHDELAARGVAFRLAEARGPARAMLSAAGLEQRFGPIEEGRSVAAAIAASDY